MDNYGLINQGITIVEIVDIRPDWSISDRGRILFDNSTGYCWIGGNSINSGENGWFRVGLDNSVVENNNILWDYTHSGDINAISATSIPCKFGDTTTFVQTAIDSIIDELISLSKGEILQPGAIKRYHLDTTSLYRIDARVIPIENENGYFPNSIKFIEDALNFLITRTASDILIDPSSNFGTSLGITATTVQEALDAFENYLMNISADEVSAFYPLVPGRSNVQFVLDAHYQLIKNIKFNDLIGVPSNFGNPGQFLRTDGVSRIYYDDLIANDIKCFYPKTIETNLQTALFQIKSELTDIRVKISNFVRDAEDVSYTGNSMFTNVDEALDWLLENSYTISSLPTALEIIACGIGDATNVQDSLIELHRQFSELLASIPCDVPASNVSCTTIMGHDNVQDAIEFLFSKISTSCIGPPGDPGKKGPPGFPGLPGLIGPPGSPGCAGLIGPIGAPGIDGVDGLIGPPGAQGPPGPPGCPGADGDPGAPGAPGDPGVKGPKGPKGCIGAPGAPGAPGDPGNPGHDGPTGGTGGTGKTGAPGAPGTGPGITGGTGRTGNPGGPGGTGAPGAPGNCGSVIAPTGAPGAPGGTGAPGAGCI